MADFRTNLAMPSPKDFKDSTGAFNNRVEHASIFHGNYKNHVRKIRAIFHRTKSLCNKKEFSNQVSKELANQICKLR